MTGLKPVQKSNSRPQSASDRLEAQKQQDRQQQRPSKSKSRYTNEDESRGEGFNSDVNVDEEMNIKPVMTLTGLSPSVPSQTISGNTNELQGATSITCMKSRPRGHGGTSRSIRRTLNGTNAGDTAMEDIAPELPSQHNKNVMSISEQSEAGQAVVQSEDSEEEDGDIMKSSRRPAKRNLGLLKTFHDVGGYSLGRGLYIWHNQKDDRFDVTQDDAEPIAILFSQLKTFAIDPGGNGVFCLLEGVKSPYGGCGGLVTYWAGLQFSSPNGLKDFTGCLRNKNISSNTSHNEYVLVYPYWFSLLTYPQSETGLRIPSRTRRTHEMRTEERRHQSLPTKPLPRLNPQRTRAERPQPMAQVKLKLDIR